MCQHAEIIKKKNQIILFYDIFWHNLWGNETKQDITTTSQKIVKLSPDSIDLISLSNVFHYLQEKSTRIFKVIKVRRNFHILTTSCSPPAVGTQITMYSRTFPSGGSQRTFKVLVVGSVTCRFLTKPSGSEQKYSQNRKSVSAWIWVTYL